ncbi:GFA family protein [Variovorax sp. LjRoot178]|uniref:GFA family protein n=1 Tax=Variovorax sp. LjRoot178 TaxID=3342277 RepID=UPI003F512C48
MGNDLDTSATIAQEPGRSAGGCQCGAIRYEVVAAPLRPYVCHCRECQKQSGSAFGISIPVPAGAFHLVSGTPVVWTRTGDSGALLDCAFCGTCGSRVWHRARADVTTIYLKGGSLDEPVDLSAAHHIWTSRMLRGVVVPEGATCSPEEPAGSE